jgi:hypothetical protein
MNAYEKAQAVAAQAVQVMDALAGGIWEHASEDLTSLGAAANHMQAISMKLTANWVHVTACQNEAHKVSVLVENSALSMCLVALFELLRHNPQWSDKAILRDQIASAWRAAREHGNKAHESATATLAAVIEKRETEER